MQYRSRPDITAQILEVAQEYSSPTKIMYRAYLSYSQLKEYMAVLIENGLILQDDRGKSRLYKTTPKGLRFLNAYAQLDTLMSKNAIA